MANNKSTTKSAPKLAKTDVKRSAPMAIGGTTATINKATMGHVASELDFIKTGFEILMEYTFEGGPQRHKEWLVDVLNDRVKEVHKAAWALDAATE